MATVCPCILSKANGDFVNWVIFLGQGDRLFGKKQISKVYNLTKALDI